MGRQKDADSAQTFERILAATLSLLTDQVEPKLPSLRAVAKRADAACMADCLHFNRLTLPEIRDGARAAGVNARPL